MTEEVFQLVLESLESDIDKESFDKILGFLIKNQKVKTSCYANKTCLSRSSLISNTSARHERHEWDTSATRVGHECYKNDTSATWVKNFDFENDTGKNIFSHRYIYDMAIERLQGKEQFHTKN